MRRKDFLRTACLLGASLWLRPCAAADDGIVVIANAPLRGVDLDTLRRIYSGRIVELDGQPLRPVNLPSGAALRQRFLARLLQQDDEAYTAYWTVRRYIGQGVPPRELRSSAEVVDYVSRTPGAVGYVEPADLRPGLTVLLRR